ncbi:hypothetical protein N9A28_00375 [Sulfurimonas sp.]|nr:hypothetical protein [Sulfurimonas sp.]
MKKMNLLVLVCTMLASTVVLADKPSWAGNGGKPSKAEKKQHKEEMTSKHKYKKNKRKDKKYREREDEEHEYRERESERREYIEETPERTVDRSLSNKEYIDEKVDETQKNWIDKAFDFLN